jgi:D-3-phosphoglycerate dehydrogenase
VDDAVDALVFDLVAWLAKNERPYAEVMDAWRTSCPRLPVWEEANERGYVTRVHDADRGATVRVTSEGLAFLEMRRHAAAPGGSAV